jgi:aminoglycoside 3-N-acetyltransferase
MITSGQLQKAFMGLGITKGDHVALGMSFKSIGWVDGGPESFVESLLDVVGPGGTIMIPTFTPYYPLFMVKYHKVPFLRNMVTVFRKEETPSYAGIIPEYIRNDPRAIRSNHPTNSYAAIGHEAAYLLGDHDYNSLAYSPYSRLADINGKLLTIGLGYRFVGIRHEAQYKAGLLNHVPLNVGALFYDESGRTSIFIRKDPGGCGKRLSEMISDLREAGIVTEGTIGKAQAVVIPVKESLDIMTNLLERNPENYLCESTWCLWCREIERRLNLCDKVDNRKWFQRNPFLRFPLDVYNSLRLSKISALTMVAYLLQIAISKLVR